MSRNYTLRLSKRISRFDLDRFLEAEYRRIGGGARVLSVGAGGPIVDRLARHAADRPFSITTLDVDAEREPHVLGDVTDPPDGLGPFDVVVMGEVLEHVREPQRALDAVRGLLVDGGRLVLTVPFAVGLHNRPTDFYRFTAYGLEHLLRDWNTVQVRPRGTWAEVASIALVRMVKEPHPVARTLAPVLVALGAVLWPLARLLGRLVPSDGLPVGYDVVATAPCSRPDQVDRPAQPENRERAAGQQPEGGGVHAEHDHEARGHGGHARG